MGTPAPASSCRFNDGLIFVADSNQQHSCSCTTEAAVSTRNLHVAVPGEPVATSTRGGLFYAASSSLRSSGMMPRLIALLLDLEHVYSCNEFAYLAFDHSKTLRAIVSSAI